MEREFSEFSVEVERAGVSETEEDKAVENPTITTKQQLKRAKKASSFIQTKVVTPVYQKAAKTVWKAKDKSKKKKDIFVE